MSFQRNEENWEQRFEELKDYRKEYGNCNVPWNYQHNKQLGYWVNRQRVQYKKFQKGEHSQITKERISKLDSIGFAWEVGNTGGGLTNDELWEGRFEELKDYRKEYGNCNVPKEYQDNKQLGYWVSRQRQQYKKFQKGATAYITQERISKLNSIGFVWSFVLVDDCVGGGLINNGNKKRTRDGIACSILEDESKSNNQTTQDEDDGHAEAIAVFMEAYDPLPKNPRFKKGC